MPLLYKKPFERNELPDELQDTDEVFYCELTNEIFRDYEEFCERIILCNSLVWSCALTGKSNLTFQEALSSEENAKKSLKEFPMQLRIPVLYLTSLTERKSLNELAEDVFCFTRDRYFLGETVEVAITPETLCSCHVVKVLEPTDTQLEEYKKVQTKNGERQFWPPANLYRYGVEPLEEESEQEHIVMANQIHRKKGVYSREKNRLYIKQFIEQKGGIWRLKESTANKSGISLVKFNQIFVGKSPVLNQVKKSLINGMSKSNDDSSKKEKRQESLDKYFSKKSPSKESQSSKHISPKKPGDTPQKIMAKKLKEKYKTVNNMKRSKLMKHKQDILKEKRKYTKKDQLQANHIPLTREELQDIKERNRAQILKLRDEKKKKKKELAKEEKQEIKERKKAEILKLRNEKKKKQMELANFMKEWNRRREDLELEDLKEMPTPVPLQLRIPNEYFGDFVMVMEFLHTFGDFVQIKDYFPGGLTFDILERALVEKEVAGPLCDILQMFLDAIFKLQEEEEDEISATDLGKEPDLSDYRRDPALLEAVKTATRAAGWCQLYQGTPLSKLTIDASTMTEVLRLHLLASGGRCGENSTKWRFQQRGGYTFSDDPGLILRMQQPHILRTLSQSTVCDIPIGDKLAILSCLINQILTYSNLRDELDERSEKVKQGKIELRSLHAADARREKEVLIRLKAGEITPEQLNQEKAVIEKQKQGYKRKAEELNELNAFTQVMPLGLDRAYRRFWMFSSLPGIFIEHDNQFSGTCLPKPTPLNQKMMIVEDPQTYVRRLFEEGSNKENLAADKFIKTPGTPNKKLLVEKNGDCEDTIRNKPSDQLMPLTCWADPVNCPVHGANKVSWAFINEESDLDRLIESLNDRGIREHNLRKTLLEEKEKIILSIAKCPSSKLNSLIPPKGEEPRKTPRNNNSKYENANLNFPPETSSDEILESVLRDLIYETEQKINDGCLGLLKVDDREAWKTALISNSYDKQCDRLIWGIKKRHLANPNNIPEDDEKSEESGSRPDTPSSEIDYKDPLKCQGNDIIQSRTIRDLASAILQVEQSIDPKYLKRPLGLDDKERNKDIESLKKEDPARTKERWETSLMSSTSLPQLFLHFTTLDNSIAWGKSILKAYCRICRRRGDPEKMLLCDKCNKGHHMYCLKPQLKRVPEGDWYCVRCKPREKVITVKKAKPSFTTESEVEDVTDDKKLKKRILPIGRCKVCKVSGNLVTCDSCDKGQHFECIYPPIRKIPAGKWFCHNCRQPNLSTIQDETSPTEAERSSRRRCSKAATAKISQFAKQLRSNSWDDDKNETGTPVLNSRRRSRRSLETDIGLSPSIAKDLPLDNATLQEMLEALMHHKDAWPFLRPVTRSDVPDYRNIIKRPMDFGTIKHKLNMLEYRNNSEVIADALLVFENCFAYNQNDTDVYQCGVRLQKAFEKLCKERSLSLIEEELRIPETKRSRTVF